MSPSTMTNYQGGSTPATLKGKIYPATPVAGIRSIPPGIRRVFAFGRCGRILILTMSEMLDIQCFPASFNEEPSPEIIFPYYSFEYVARTLGCNNPSVLQEKYTCIMQINHHPNAYDRHIDMFWSAIKPIIESFEDDDGELYHKRMQGLLLLQADISYQTGNIYHTHTSLVNALQSFSISKDEQSIRYTQSALDYIHLPPAGYITI